MDGGTGHPEEQGEESRMNEQKTDARYPMGRSQEETERLIHQERVYGGITRRFFMEAGIASGMQVLDVGSGAGDVALTVAELVGPNGNVVGVDVNENILETARIRAREAGWTNVEFMAGDDRTLDAAGDFDAVVGRLTLMYMSDPADALKRFTRYLRPGGLVAFEEADLTPYRALVRPDTPLMNTLIGWALDVFERSGAHVGMGLDLSRAFVDAGLPVPVLHLEAPVGGSETWVGYRYLAEIFRSLLPLLEEYGMATGDEVDLETLEERLRREAVAAKRPVVLPPHVTAWTRLAP